MGGHGRAGEVAGHGENYGNYRVAVFCEIQEGSANLLGWPVLQPWPLDSTCSRSRTRQARRRTPDFARPSTRHLVLLQHREHSAIAQCHDAMRCHSIEFSGMIGATFRAKRSASSFKLATARSRIVAKLGLPSTTPRAMAASTRVQRSNGALFDHFVGVVQA